MKTLHFCDFRGFAKGVAGTVPLPFVSVFFPFLPLFPFFSLFSFRFLPFCSVSFSEKKRGDTVRETPFAKPEILGDAEISCLSAKDFCYLATKVWWCLEGQIPGARSAGARFSILQAVRLIHRSRYLSEEKGSPFKLIRQEKKRVGWHVCRTKLARKIFFETRIFSRKRSENFPEMFEPLLFCGSAKNPAKFLQNFPPPDQRKITDELLQERREKGEHKD